MRVFIYEYACALDQGLSVAESIRAEGRAMLSAVVEDFARVPDVQVLTLLGAPPGGEEEAFRSHAAAADWSLVIAPEFDGLLLTRCRWVEEAGGRLLGPSLAAVELASDKWATYQLLREAGVPTPETWLLPGAREMGGRGGIFDAPVVREPAGASKTPPRPLMSMVVKPRFGAGSQDVRLVADAHLVRAAGRLLAQEHVAGVAASVAFLTGPGRLVPLAPAYQRLSDDGRFRYLGGKIPLSPSLAKRAVPLARRALEALPGLRGYVGVDLVLGDVGNHADFVIEINPRLTTSYVGLRVLARTNLAEAMLAAAAGEPPELQWREGAVAFEADGRVAVPAAGE